MSRGPGIVNSTRVAVAVGCVFGQCGGGLFVALAGEHTEHTGKHVSRRAAASNFSHSWHWSHAGQLGRLAHAKRGEQQRFGLRQ